MTTCLITHHYLPKEPLLDGPTHLSPFDPCLTDVSAQKEAAESQFALFFTRILG
jgi:hypothetical protein